MSDKNVVVGLDIGTTKVAVCVGQISEGLIHILALAKAPNSGLRKGIVVDIEECVSSISGALEHAERMAGVQLDHAVAGISGAQVTASNSKGVIAVSRPDGEINQSDVDRVLEAARVIALPPNREILHVIPRQFIVDGQDGIKDPIGMTGIRLEVETLAIGGSSAAIKNLTKCIFQAGVEIDALIYTPLATAKALLNRKQRENGVALVDFGGGTTSLAIFEENEIVHTAVLPVGSLHITNDLAIGLRVSLETAEKIKIQYGTANKDAVKETEKVDLSKLDTDETQRIERKMIAEIIDARLKEIFGMVKDELRSIGKDGMLPAGIVFTGGGTLLDGLIDFAKEELHLPAHMSKPTLEVSGMVDKLDHPVYAASIGLMLQGLEGTHTPHTRSSRIALPNSMNGLVNKMKDALKQFLP